MKLFAHYQVNGGTYGQHDLQAKAAFAHGDIRTAQVQAEVAVQTDLPIGGGEDDQQIAQDDDQQPQPAAVQRTAQRIHDGPNEDRKDRKGHRQGYYRPQGRGGCSGVGTGVRFDLLQADVAKPFVTGDAERFQQEGLFADEQDKLDGFPARAVVGLHAQVGGGEGVIADAGGQERAKLCRGSFDGFTADLRGQDGVHQIRISGQQTVHELPGERRGAGFLRLVGHDVKQPLRQHPAAAHAEAERHKQQAYEYPFHDVIPPGVFFGIIIP